jgi:phage-related protein
MSYIISGLNIQNISEYNFNNSYSKYDIVDFQLFTGASLSPAYTGNGQTGLTTWFNNDLLEYFKTDTKFDVTGWRNLVSGSGDLNQTGAFAATNPYVDFNENYINLFNDQTLSGTGFASDSRTLIFLIEAADLKKVDQSQKILQFGTDSTYGKFLLSGTNSYNQAKILLDNTEFNSVSSLYNDKNIFTLIQDNAAGTIKLRQNGIDLGTYSSFNANWKATNFILGNNNDSVDIKYYEVIHFTGVVADSQISGYEKYLYEKYFDNTRLYFAFNNVSAGIQYSPITYTGIGYWTQDIDDLFKMNYGCSANFTSNLSMLQMGDGYKTNVAQTVNTLNSKFNLNYDGLTDKEAKCLITYFENSPETKKKSLYEGYKGVEMNLFPPYKKNAELYFKSIDHSTIYNDINSIKIEAESLYDSSLDYKGMLVELDEINIKTYPSDNKFNSINYNDIFYYDSDSVKLRGYYFYTGSAYNIDENSTITTGPFVVSPVNSPTGISSWFTKDFYFKGNIDYNINSSLRLLKGDFKNSTTEYDKDGINYNILEFNVDFKNRSNSETRAILKFLDDKAGYKVFKYTLPQPYNKEINVYCPEWNHTYNFNNNNDIGVKFIEFKNPFDTATKFNTKLYFTQ